ncbi:MAG TPA: M20/M25/M40 family metallo-hydrolase, partial [Anaeromyxobacteraceae bacterium]|nr:M20/M25/M40 family metallo-hydrolase [Anaeromyxobacteraceae bacterium]
MSDLLDDLEPKPLFDYFLQLSRIPRGSKQEAAAAAWVAEQGRALGCEVLRDAAGNVLLRQAATPGREGRPGVALQCHVDMVCEKNEGTAHDFARDPIRVRCDGDVLRATGTTLGADNGIGVAAALAVLAARDVAHPPLEVLVTVDEETGLAGANGLAPGWLRAKTLLNLDSEEEGELTIGCAGGVDTVARRRVTRAAAPGGAVARRIKVSGLKGGHSGIDIGAGRASSLRVLGQVLDAVAAPHGLGLVAVQGGNKRNAIAREASAVVLCRPDRVAALDADVARLA